MTLDEICIMIKEKGPNYAIIGFNARLAELEEISRCLAKGLAENKDQAIRIDTLSRKINNGSNQMKTINENILEVRACFIEENSKKIIEFKKEDVYEVNKRVEKLHREIELIKSITDFDKLIEVRKALYVLPILSIILSIIAVLMVIL